MFSRRTFLLSTAIAGLASSSPAFCEPKDAATSEGEKLQALFDAFFQERLQRDPALATELGLDKGALFDLKRRLGEFSPASLARDAAETARRLDDLRKIDRASLGAFDAVSYETVLFTDETRDENNRLFSYGAGAGSPYILTQLSGAYHWLPDFLDTQHRIDTVEDADAYLARLGEIPRAMDDELELVRRDAALGVAPPDFIIDKTVILIRRFAETPAEKATLVQSLVRRARAKNLAGEWSAQATAIYDGKILPAVARQIAVLQDLRAQAPHDAGVGRLPAGADYYRVSLKKYTTSTLSPDEIHASGLDLVARLSAEIAVKLDAQGVAGGSVGQRLAALGAEPEFLYDNTDAAKEILIADLNAKVAILWTKLPDYFGALPKAAVEIRRVPKEIEAGAPGGYYQPGTLDGARPGAYYINLRNTAEWARWRLPTLTYHESIPGHHLQIALANETARLPPIRKAINFSGYAEGWALYAEQLAVEMGLYDNDPLGHIGQLQAALFRAVRLVVDSGLHARGWSREQAISYFVDTLGEKESVATTEVERYCVWPGQACSYMVGKLTILRLREEARLELGEKFDLKKFHDAALLSGSMPLAVLDRAIGDYIAAAKA